MRKFIIVFCASALIVVIGIHLLLSPSFPLPPKIRRNLPDSFAEADKEFARRIIAEYPLPLKEQELVRFLEQDGFSISKGKSYAYFEKQSFPCMLRWLVFWEAQNDTIVELKPNFGGSCL